MSSKWWLAVALAYMALHVLLAAGTFVGHTTLQARGVKRTRVLCVGDSATEGYVSYDRPPHPYAKMLVQLAQEANVANFEVVEEGVQGQLVVPTTVERTMMQLAAAEASGQDYTHVIVQGGYDDINRVKKAADIFDGMLRIYKEAGKAGAHVVALTLYQYNATMLGSQEEIRVELNRLIRQHAQAQPGKVSLVDIDLHITRETQSKTTPSSNLYSSILHLTEEGYDYMGRLIWEQAFKPALVASTQ